MAQLEFPVAGHRQAAVRACEAEVFRHWYQDTPDEFRVAYGPYETQTLFVAIRDDDDRVLGFSRLILPGARPLKTLDDVARPPWSLDVEATAAGCGLDPVSTWDVATLGVALHLGATGRTVALALYHGVLRAAQANGIRFVVAVLDVRVRRLLNSLGLVMHPLPGARTHRYLGSPASTPMQAEVATLLAHHEAGREDSRYRLELPGGPQFLDLSVELSLELPLACLPGAQEPSTPASITLPADSPSTRS